MESFGGKIKINEVKTNVFILLFFLFLSSCDLYFFNIAIDDDGFSKSFSFECGKIDVSGNIMDKSHITVSAAFKLDYPVLIDPEKFEVKYKGEAIKSIIYLNNNSPLQKIESINEDSKVRIVIRQKVQSGDTIKINIDNFIVCKGKPLEIGEINLVIVNRK